jgi:hypothetical protein
MGATLSREYSHRCPGKNAMTQTIGELGKMRPWPPKRDLFRASRTKCASTSKMGPVADSLRGSYGAGSTSASLYSAGLKLTIVVTASVSASLRSVQTEIPHLRGGNDARRKAWKPQTLSFPPFPPRLEIRQKAPDFHIPTASTAAISHYLKLSRAPPHRIR